MGDSVRPGTGQPVSAFGERLRRLRETAGLTQEELAAQAGLSVNAIGGLERGYRRHPYPRTIQVIASVLGLSDEAREELVALIPRRGGKATAGRPEPGALPIPANVLIGRDALIDEAVACLRRPVRLLTLTGPGGVGKTCLALRVAAEYQDEMSDGARVVSLVQVTDAQAVPQAIARGLGVVAASHADPVDALLAWLRPRQMVVVIDNVEQVIEAAPLLAELLAACAGLQIIVTSRHPLHLDAEQEFPVPPLALPVCDPESSIDDLARVPAIALFLERARAVRPAMTLTADNTGAIVAICERLDGLPLAIELAAARAKLLSPQAMVEMLDRSLHLLVGGGADRPSRLQTMRNAIAWSYNLLEPAQQRLFRHLSVFAGGCALDAVGQVAGDREMEDHALIGEVAVLIDHSLVLREDVAGGGVRVRMLEVIREFGAEQLQTHGEEAAIRTSHAAWCLDMATAACRQIEGPQRRAAHRAIRRDLQNQWAAMAWLVSSGNAEGAHHLANALARFWIDLGHIGEGRRWLERVVTMDEGVPSAPHAEALYWAAGFANLQNDRARAHELANQSLALARDHGDTWHAALALTQLAGALAPEDPGAARPLVEEALAGFRAAGDAIQEGIALRQIGDLDRRCGEHDAATRHFAEALVIWRRLDHPWGIPSTLQDQAGEALRQHDAPLAWMLYRESLVRWLDLGERMHMSDSLHGLVRSALAMGLPETAAMLFGAEDALNDSMGYVPPDEEHAEIAATIETAAGSAVFAHMRATGAAQSLTAMVDAVLAVAVPQPKG